MNRRNSARWVNETHGKMRSAKIEVLLNAWMVVETEKQKHTEKQFFLQSSKIENSNQGCSTWLYMHVFCGLNLQKWELVVRLIKWEHDIKIVSDNNSMYTYWIFCTYSNINKYVVRNNFNT